jgi:hypothetical protein
MLWDAAGGPQRAGWGEPKSVAVWRNYLKAARKFRPPHDAGKLIEHILTRSDRVRDNTRVRNSGRIYNQPSWLAFIAEEASKGGHPKKAD